MTAPRLMPVVVDGLPTTSAKIRALAAEGYLRADIARFLGIAYQHVRKVLEDAGSREGLQRNVVPSTPTKPAPAADTLTVDTLVAAGFTRLGTWRAGDDGIELEMPRLSAPVFTPSQSTARSSTLASRTAPSTSACTSTGAVILGRRRTLVLTPSSLQSWRRAGRSRSIWPCRILRSGTVCPSIWRLASRRA
jgi:hypothetical protein